MATFDWIPFAAALVGGAVTSIIGWILASRERESRIARHHSENEEATITSFAKLLEAERENADRQKAAKKECWEEVLELKMTPCKDRRNFC
jgi:hypothetical protein